MIRVLTLVSSTGDGYVVIVVQVRLALGSQAAILSPDAGSQVTVLDQLAVEQLQKIKENLSQVNDIS